MLKAIHRIEDGVQVIEPGSVFAIAETDVARLLEIGAAIRVADPPAEEPKPVAPSIVPAAPLSTGKKGRQ